MGTRSVPIQNAFVRTFSTYSRRMTAKIFFQLIASSFDRTRLFEAGLLDGGDVDLFELRLLLGKGADLVALEGAPQELSAIGSRRERDHIGAVHRRDGS